MSSSNQRDVAQSLHVHVDDLPETEQAGWHEAVARLHRLTLLGLGEDLASVRVDLATRASEGAQGNDIACRLTVRLRRPRHALNVETSHPDGSLALTQAFTRAQREAQRHLDSARREARRQVLGQS